MATQLPLTATEMQARNEIARLQYEKIDADFTHAVTRPLLEDMARIVGVDLAKDQLIFSSADLEKHRRDLLKYKWEEDKKQAAEQIRAKFPAWTNLDKIKMRLGVEPADNLNYHINIYVGPNRAFVFVAKDDKGLILEDDKNLFPSDALIGQLQLWAGSL